MIKLSKPHIDDASINSVIEVLRSGQLVHGNECASFEIEIAKYLGCKECVLVSSGTAALHIALQSLDLGTNTAIIVPDFTFPATANVVALQNFRVVNVDVNLNNYTISIDALKNVIENWRGPEKIKAIMPVHEFGCPVDMECLMNLSKEYELYVIEDAACAIGCIYNNKKIGTFGDMGCFSFHPRKTITTGEGGAIVTNDDKLADKVRRLRNHGIDYKNNKINFVEPGWNYRLTNFQAALGRRQLADLDNRIQRRSELTRYYCELLESVHKSGYIHLPELINGHSFQTFMIVLDERYSRNKVINFLKDKMIESNLGAHSLHSLQIYNNTNYCPVGGFLYRQGLALPLYEQMTKEDVQYVCNNLVECLYSDEVLSNE